MAKRDFYDVLGVKKTASADEIKAAHRKLVRRYHPDVSKGDKSHETKFKETQEAYDVLSDAEKKKKYDQFGHAGLETGGGPGGGYGPEMYEQFRRSAGGRAAPAAEETFDPSDFGNGQFHDVFEQLFGSRGPFGRSQPPGGRRGAAPADMPAGTDVEYPVTINFAEAARGSSLPIQISRAGKIETIEAKVPAGVKEGTRVRIKGRGNSAVGGVAGDLFIVVSVRPHEYFRREGLDVMLDLPLSLYEAIEGARVTVPTLDGSVQVTVPPGTSSGAKLRIRERGIFRGQEKGDQYCVIRIVVPKKFDDADRQTLRAIEKKRPLDARADTAWKVD